MTSYPQSCFMPFSTIFLSVKNNESSKKEREQVNICAYGRPCLSKYLIPCLQKSLIAKYYETFSNKNFEIVFTKQFETVFIIHFLKRSPGNVSY